MDPSPSPEDLDGSARPWRPTGTVEARTHALGEAAPVPPAGKRLWRLRVSRKIIGFAVLAIVILGASMFDRLANNSGWANSKAEYDDALRD